MRTSIESVVPGMSALGFAILAMKRTRALAVRIDDRELVNLLTIKINELVR